MSDETSLLLNQESRNDPYIANFSESTNIPRNTEDVEYQVEEPTMKSFLAVLLSMMLGLLLSTMSGTIIIASYAKIGSNFNQLQISGWLLMSYLLTNAAGQSLYGKLGDVFGRKQSLLFSLILFTIGTLCCGLSQNIQQLIAGRVIQGIGGGVGAVITIIMVDIIPIRSRSLWLGVKTLVEASGHVLGAAIGGLFADTIGWQWSFLLQLPFLVAATALVVFTLNLPEEEYEPQDFRDKLNRVDFTGPTTLVLAVFFLVFGLDRLGNYSWSDPWLTGSLAACVILIYASLTIELRFAKEPFAPKRIMMNRSLFLINAGNFFISMTSMTFIFFLSLYFQATIRQTASQTSFWIILTLGAHAIGSLFTSFAIKSTGKYHEIMVVGLILHGFGVALVLLFAGIVVRCSNAIAFGLVLTAFGSALSADAYSVGLFAIADKDDEAVVTNIHFVCKTLGGVCGIGAGSALVQHVLRSTLQQWLKEQDIEQIIVHVRASLSYIHTLDSHTQEIVRLAYERATQAVLLFITCAAGLTLLSSLFIEERPLIKRQKSCTCFQDVVEVYNIHGNDGMAMSYYCDECI